MPIDKDKLYGKDLQAFPSVGEGFGNPLYSAPGMTLRDYFAAAALTGFMANQEYFTPVSDRKSVLTDQEMARRFYHMADAMLTEREGGDGDS